MRGECPIIGAEEGFNWTCDVLSACVHIQCESMEKIMLNMLTENMASLSFHGDGHIRYDYIDLIYSKKGEKSQQLWPSILYIKLFFTVISLLKI